MQSSGVRFLLFRVPKSVSDSILHFFNPSTKLSAAMCMGRDPSLNTMCMYDGFFLQILAAKRMPNIY